MENDHDAIQAYWIDLLGFFGFIHFIPNRMEALLQHQQWLHPQTESPGGTELTLPVQHDLHQETFPTLDLNRIGQWIHSNQE